MDTIWLGIKVLIVWTVIIILIACLLPGCSTKPARDYKVERALKIAVLKLAMSPEWTVEDYKKEIRYQMYLLSEQEKQL